MPWQDFVVFMAYLWLQRSLIFKLIFLSWSLCLWVRSDWNLYLQMPHQYLSGCFTRGFYKVQLFRLNAGIRPPPVPPRRYGGSSAPEDAREPPPRPPLPAVGLRRRLHPRCPQWHRYPLPRAWGGVGEKGSSSPARGGHPRPRCPLAFRKELSQPAVCISLELAG